jgi:carbon-monoxide dehydrogenase large subunit
MNFGIGQPVRRKEDQRLITGRGEFGDDVNLPNQAYAVILRSPHAHARIVEIDTRAARAAPGVLAVLTGRDYVAQGLKALPNNPVPRDLPLGKREQPLFAPPDYPLAVDKARHVGEGVALIVAATHLAALDAAERVKVEYDVLPSVTDVADALADGAPTIWDEAPDNVCADGERGDKAAADAAFAHAAHVTRMEIRNNRVNGVPLEPGVAVGVHDAGTGRFTLHAPGQGVLIQKRGLCHVFGVDDDKVRVICRDVGGGFGTRNLLYREHALVLWAARAVGRPVKWRGERSESFVSDPYGRDLTTEIELALDARGRFLAIRGRNIANIGSQVLHLVPLVRGAAVTNGLYVIPAMHMRLQAVFTNTVPTSTYRGAGRPEAMFIIERLIDTAAAEMDIDRVKLRRRNFIQPAMLPYTNAFGTRYDSGEFEPNMVAALEIIDLAGFKTRRKESRRRGRLRGLGFGNYIETATGIPPERAVINVRPEGMVEITLGTQASGQGHETSFAQMVVDFLGVPFDSVLLRHGDTDIVKMGSGSHSSRSMRLGGLLLGRAAAEIVAKGKKLAARALQADEGEVEFADGTFSVTGTERSIGLFAVAKLAAELAGPEHVLEASADITTSLPTFPNGCHVCEVEVDPDTGAVTIDRWAAIDDVGRIINPLLVDGQVHGGIAQGAGQALTEVCAYDPDSGQLLTASFMDYGMPRADMFPPFVIENNEVLAPNNPLGVKGGGEGGSTGAPPAIINAIVDALRELGVRDVPMPATPERVWQAIRQAQKGATPRPARKRSAIDRRAT